MIKFLTHSGRILDISNLNEEDIHLRDIAHSLSLICRYGGHTDRHYSVAEHSIIIAKCLESIQSFSDLSLNALMHDSSESYTGDIVTSLKRKLNIKKLENKILKTIFKKYGINNNNNGHVVVDILDKWVTHFEIKHLIRKANLLFFEEDYRIHSILTDISYKKSIDIVNQRLMKERTKSQIEEEFVDYFTILFDKYSIRVNK